ncbi:MAG: hypothetical protein II926_04505 [Bacteroidales bacterium]|nr:hypothetical protein [Bacteroidales bacterium]
MKRFILILVLFCSSIVYGQYSNLWIDYSQTYYKIPVTSEGVYRVTYADLIANGISVGDFDHRNLQIIHDGKVLPLFVSAQADGIFRATDYFEFYAESGNTGWLDAQVYSSGVPFNPQYSLYNDTAAYFLTFANTLTSPRYDTARSMNFSQYTPQPYCLRKVRSNYTSTFNATNSSSYILPSEGWTDAFFDMGESVSKGVITTNYAEVGVASEISFGLGGFSQTEHDVIVTLSADESFRWDTNYYDYDAIHKTIRTTKPLTAVTTLKFQSLADDKAADKNTVSYVQILYPATFNCNNQPRFMFELPEIAQGDSILLQFENFNAGSSVPILYCPEIQKRILTSEQDGKFVALVPNCHKQLHCVLISQQVFSKIIGIQSVASKNSSESKFYDFSLPEHQGDYIIITNKKLWNQASLYKQYRQSTGQTVVLVDIDELYDQFAYGIRSHPYAISSFIAYALRNWSILPEHVFLIGKGFHVSDFRNNSSLYGRLMLPTMGNPASDLLFTMSTRATSIRTNIAIGRLSAETPKEVEIYCQKVIDFESQEPSPWMKNVIHFGGGTTAIEQTTFRRYLTQYAQSLRGEYFGADVHSFYKQSSDIYETTEPEAIRKYVNEGTALITFFGHASGSGFDQNIDHPSIFDNQGRYPLILANSCYSGDIFADNDYNVSKIWTFAENRGSIGFLANVGTGVPNYLNVFSSAFVRNIAYSNYGKSIGSSVAKTMNDLSNKMFVYPELYDGIVDFTLQGDPIVKLHSFEKPDLTVDETSVFFTPSLLTTDMETMTVNFVVRNNGRAFNSAYSLRATFTSLEGEVYVLEKIVNGAYCRDTLSYDLPMEDFASGEYTLKLEIDTEQDIEELNESNNETEISFFISTRDMLPIYPTNCAIIPTNTVTLYMSSVDAMNPPKAVIVEIDTVCTYDSELKSSTTIQTDGSSIVSWTPNLTLINNTTYFWRVTSSDTLKWNEYSFTYEEGKTGWGQIHRRQFMENSLRHLSYNDTTKKYAFLSLPHEISVKTRGNAANKKDYYECLFAIDETMMENTGFPENSPALHLIVLDSATLDPWLSSRANYGQRNYPSANGRVRYYMAFTANNATAQKNMATLMLDSVPDGNYILCYSYINPYCQSWDESLKEAMDSLGFSVYKNVPDDYPYIFYMKKGDKTTCEEIVGDSARALIHFRKNLYANYTNGTIYSPRIGPASNFHSVVWNAKKKGVDKAYVVMLMATSNEHEYSFMTMQAPTETMIDSVIATDTYPYMRLNCYMEDVERTPIDMNSWKVYYTPTAELTVSPRYAFSFSNDSVQQGEPAQVVISARNVAPVDMDSVMVLYEIRNNSNELVYWEYKMIGDCKSYQYVIDTNIFDTKTFVGEYTLKVEFNPINPETGVYYQEETARFNNVMYHTFYVVRDKSAPVVDVMVDGRHLRNGDNVSAEPEIRVVLFDENKYFPINSDTSLFTITLINVETKETIPCYFADSTMYIIAAESNANKSVVICKPTFVDEGQYELRVQVQDVTGNFASTQEYKVQFEVSFENRVSVMYNYPNPCMNYTTFRFVLAGSEIPSGVYIEIVDAQGQKKSQIPVNSVHIGTNEVLVSWEKDYDLSEGVYFYRLMFDGKSSWENLPISKGSIKKEWGRMIIVW